MSISLTSDQLVRGMKAVPAAADLWVDWINEATHRYRINDNKLRLVSFLAQIAHESGSLEHAREIWGPTRAQRRYEGRRDLGNIYPGDGKRFMGRALIQVTGRNNYREAYRQIKELIPDCPDFEAKPELLELPRWGALAAANFWYHKGLNALGDKGETVKITRIVNGGYNGLLDRRRHFKRLLGVM